MYSIYIHKKPSLKYNGYTDTAKKEIHIFNNKKRKTETLAHELIHAFLFECGHDGFCRNETLVHALGRFFEKLFEVYSKLVLELEERD